MSSVNVLYRIKYTEQDSDILEVKKNSIIIENQVKTVSNKKTYKKFNKLNIFDKTYRNESIFSNYFKEILDQFLKNNIPTFSTLAYGQTGSGKTYTLFGSPKNKGVLYNIMEYLFSNNIVPTLSCLEIYGDKIYDIQNNKAFIQIYDAYNSLKYSREVIEKKLDSYKTFCSLFGYILSNRVTGITKLNDSSSRSHLIVKIKFNHKTIYIIDLAGNEKGKYSLAHKNKILLQEYIGINKSLFSLKECIRAISLNNKYIPYRGSKLTLLLKDIFFNNGSVHFIATISPLREHYHDIIDTIKFANSLQNKRIVLTIHKTVDYSKLLKEYFDFIMLFNKLIHKDYKLYEKIKKNNDNNNIPVYTDQLINIINEKITTLNDSINTFNKYK